MAHPMTCGPGTHRVGRRWNRTGSIGGGPRPDCGFANAHREGSDCVNTEW